MLRHGEPIELIFYPATPDDVDNGVSLAAITGATPGDVGYFFPKFKCEVVESGVLVRTGIMGTKPSNTRVTFDRRFTPNSDSGRTDADVGDIYLGVTGASAAGDVCYDLVGQDSSAGVTLEPGMEVVVAIENIGNSATGRLWPYLLVRHIPEVRANLSKMQETT